MSIDLNTVKNSLYAWAVSVSPVGTPIIYWQPNAPRPTIPYLTLFLQSVVSIGQDWASGAADVAGVINQKGDRQFTLSIQAYGGDPLTLLENIRTSLQKQSVLDTLRAGGIAFYTATTINDITDLVDSKWERRASLDVLFGIGQVYTDAPGFFDEAEITAVILNDFGNVAYTSTFTVPES